MEVAEPARAAARVLKSKTEEALLIVFVCEIQNHTDLYFIFRGLLWCIVFVCEIQNHTDLYFIFRGLLWCSRKSDCMGEVILTSQ
jgi:hypothetical protein